MYDTTRTDYIAGLRQLADILEQHDDLPLPYSGAGTHILWIAGVRPDHKGIAAAFARAIPGTVAKSPRGTDLDLVGQIAGLKVKLIVDRDQLCKRVVVGTETVTVPAQPAVDAQPEQVVEREIVEWVCHPVLADAKASA
jgi:hypothetical protein